MCGLVLDHALGVVARSRMLELTDHRHNTTRKKVERTVVTNGQR
jgi:hypothetical protein